MKIINTYKHLLLTTSITLALVPALASALPTGGTVASGTASISTSGATTTVTQSSSKAVINWAGFNTAKGETVDFKDAAGASSITLNRVSGATTSFDGALASNGNVWIINPNGILIGADSKINTNGFLATTSAITNSNFTSGNYDFTPGGGSASASVSNAGSITVAGAGLAALAAPNVANSGTITASAGKIALASGDAYTIDLAGDGLINLSASKAITQQGLTNSGRLNAGTGSVTITAAQGSGLLDNLVNLSGVVEATSLTGSGDSISYGAQFTPTANNSSFSLTAPGTITLHSNSGVGIEGGNSVNVSLFSYENGNIHVNAMPVYTNGGTFTATAQDAVNTQSIQSVYFDGSSIQTQGADVQITANGTINMVNTHISDGGYVVLEALPQSTLSTGNSSGIYLNNSDVVSELGNIVLEGNAPFNSTGSTYGISLINTGIYAYHGSTFLYGQSGATTSGGSTAVSLSGSFIYDLYGQTQITGEIEAGLASTAVKGGAADGIVLNNSTIENENLSGPSISLFGEGGTAPGHSSEGVVLTGSTLENYTTATNSGISITGYGGTGVNTTGVAVSGTTITPFEGTSVSSVGPISITGYGGTSSAGGVDAGVTFAGAVETNANGSFAADTNLLQAQDVTITGTGGSGSNSANGSGVSLSNLEIEATAAKISGQGATGAGSNNYGVQLAGGDQLFDNGSLTIVGTGVGSANDIQSNESVNAFVNTLYLAPGSGYGLIGERNKVNYQDLQIENQ